MMVKQENDKTSEASQSIITDEFMDWEERDSQSMTLLKHCIAGSAAGVMEHLALYPVDTIKTHLQASGSSRLTFFRTAQILYSEEGFVRFWKGANVMASGCIPAHSAQFCTYEVLKEQFNFKNEQFNMASTMTIGALSTFAHDFFVTPADIIKQRLQLCKSLTARQCFVDIIKNEGIRGLYRSYPVTVFMNLPYMSMVVCVNENMKTWLKPWNRDNPHAWYFLCAGVAGGMAGVATNPLDVVKTRLQTQELQPSCKKLQRVYQMSANLSNADAEPLGKTQTEQIRCKDAAGVPCGPEPGNKPSSQCNFEVRQVRYQNVFQTIQQVHAREGLSGFYRGVFPRMMINVPSTALSWGTYEIVKGLLKNNNQ